MHALGLSAGVVLLSLGLSAIPITITFDSGDPIGGLVSGSVLGSQYAAATGATFSANAISGSGGATGNWATNTNLTIADAAGSGVGGLRAPSLVSGNLLHSINGWANEDGDASFRISFANPVRDFSATFAGIKTAGSTRVFAYNGATLLATVAAARTGQQVVSVSGVGLIASVAVTPGDYSDWVGVDDITFTPSQQS